MKILNYLLIFLLAFLLFSCNQSSKNKIGNADTTKVAQSVSKNLKLQIYYFHATHRCPTCNSIEANVKQVLESNFKNEIKEGAISLQILNANDEANIKLSEKFEATGAALHFVKYTNGTEKDYDLTEYAFSYSRKQPEVFLKGIKDTITYFMH